MEIKLSAPVRAVDRQRVGEVHRVVVDLDQHAVIAIVVLGRGSLAGDVLVPVEFDHDGRRNARAAGTERGAGAIPRFRVQRNRLASTDVGSAGAHANARAQAARTQAARRDAWHTGARNGW